MDKSRAWVRQTNEEEDKYIGGNNTLTACHRSAMNPCETHAVCLRMVGSSAGAAARAAASVVVARAEAEAAGI